MQNKTGPSALGAELLVDVADHLAALAVKTLGIPENEALIFAQEATVHLADHWGGQTVYIPKNMVARLCARNVEIYEAFNGDNISELVTRFDLSRQAIYMIISSERERRAIKQHSLFGS